jgi:hypothetical protein
VTIPPPASGSWHRPSVIADRAVAILVTVTLVLFAAIVGLVVYLVLYVSSVAAGNHALVLQVTAAEKQVSAAEAAAHAATITSCQESNANRSEDITIWEHVLVLPPGATVLDEAAITRDLTLIREAYALRNCPAAAG